MSRRCAVSLITRWFCTSHTTVGGFVRRQAPARAQAFGDGRADVGMIAGQALGDVVQQHRAIQHLARLDALDDVGRERMLVLQLAALDGGHIADRADQMLVHRVVVVHVELHQRDDAAEFGHEAAEHAGLVHPPQRALGIAARGQDFQEQPVGLRIVAHIVVDQVERAGDGAQRVGMNVHALGVGDVEDADQIDRVAPEASGRAFSRPFSTKKSSAPVRGLRKPGRRRDSEGRGFLFCTSSAAQKMRVRSPTSFATRK